MKHPTALSRTHIRFQLVSFGLLHFVFPIAVQLERPPLADSKPYRGGPLWCTGFRRVFRSRKWGRQIGQKLNVETGSRRRRNSEKNTGRHQPPPQAHFTSPNPPRPSRRSVSDGVIQLIFVFGAMLSLVQSIGLAREGLACEN